MTWTTLLKHLKDPMNVFALLLILAGQLQQQGDLLLSLVGSKWAGLILSLIGGGVATLNFMRGLSAVRPNPDTHDDGTAGDST